MGQRSGGGYDQGNYSEAKMGENCSLSYSPLINLFFLFRLLIQIRLLSVASKSMCTKYWLIT